MIKHKSFAHGWFYHYRIHSAKTNKLCENGFSELKDYLENIFDDCPDEHFNKGPRSSKLRLDLGIRTKSLRTHDVCKWAEKGLKWNTYQTAHSNVQVFMLQHDKNTIGVEVPIWIKPVEMDNFENIFNTDEVLSGHIDLLRVNDDKIEIWDYKPNAYREKYASTQVYFYALMLAKRTQMKLDNFRCGYFDRHNAFIFNPRMEFLDKAIKKCQENQKVLMPKEN
jgi:ATP-dependent exoDNAse (exonuclease V) beta subunit